jgi:hypothetical protein
MNMTGATALTTVFVASLWVGAPVQDASKTANPELVGELAKTLNATPKQAEGAAGAIFRAAKSGLSPTEWTKVESALPGMKRLLKAAPVVPTVTAEIGEPSDIASAFSKLGLKADDRETSTSPTALQLAVMKLIQYASAKGGSEVGGLLVRALKSHLPNIVGALVHTDSVAFA